ncbi:hypothetical protein BGX27_007625 [Mortierella sp. AM989]|nr:hypothetical protein BGX27_007625 [Mortierella sp. AM989]
MSAAASIKFSKSFATTPTGTCDQASRTFLNWRSKSSEGGGLDFTYRGLTSYVFQNRVEYGFIIRSRDFDHERRVELLALLNLSGIDAAFHLLDVGTVSGAADEIPELAGIRRYFEEVGHIEVPGSFEVAETFEMVGYFQSVGSLGMVAETVNAHFPGTFWVLGLLEVADILKVVQAYRVLQTALAHPLVVVRPCEVVDAGLEVRLPTGYQRSLDLTAAKALLVLGYHWSEIESQDTDAAFLFP